ncbi:hypothetical protein [Pseudomonas psychrophila]|uniref:hypothetical protein n=1 Tax=Pseudomonas psychrophila TaxID=122355 RepID=UPI0002E5E81A|nr:hypothetical protein [Pseudomonas psychrophila]
MFINSVVSFKGAWDVVVKSDGGELEEAMEALAEMVTHMEGNEQRSSYREFWDEALNKRGWKSIGKEFYEIGGRKVNLTHMGASKNGFCVSLPMGIVDTLSRWIFQQSTLAVKLGLIEIPVMLVPMRKFFRSSGSHLVRRESFEAHLSQLEVLSPLSHQHPFLILGYSSEASVKGPTVTEILPDTNVKQPNYVVDRSIEFPSEYHQAGLGILSFFGAYLREQYPEENASVKIEQQGLTVRMIIETESGRSEVVEKALHEYELIVTGAERPEKFTKSDKLILELRAELRIAKLRVESQQDIIGVQNAMYDRFLGVVGVGLSAKNTVMIDFKPDISIVNTVEINLDIAAVLGGLNELLEGIPSTSPAHLTFKELEGALSSVEKCKDPDAVRASPAMSKFRRVIESALEKGTEINTALDKLDAGWEIFKDVAGKYNRIAEWCGLPQVPSVFVK